MDEALEELRATLDRADGVVSREPWYRSAVSHAIPPERVACSYYFAWLSRSCLGIACDFGEGRGAMDGGDVVRSMWRRKEV